MEDLAGRQFGPYRVVASLGEGGMAAVYQAYQPSVDRYVALKVLSRYFTNDPQFLERFRREAKTVAQLQHPHILPVFDFGESDGYTFLVMPFVQGGTLAELLKGSPVLLTVTTRVIRQVCEALDYAHAKGIVHRDIKPSNILIDERGNCLVADFGLARMAEGATKLTLTGAVLGTPAYMSPEQAAGKDIGPHSDIYSIGIVLYEMLTGRVPFQAETPIAVAIKHLNDPLPPPRSLNPALTADIEAVVLKALARSKRDRFASGEALVASLTAAVQSMQQGDTGFLAHDQAGAGVPAEMTHVLPQQAQPTPRFSPPAPSFAPTGTAQKDSSASLQTEEPIDTLARHVSKRTRWIGISVAVVLFLASSTAALLKLRPPDAPTVVLTPSAPTPANPESPSANTPDRLALRAELDLWDAIKDSHSITGFEDYLKRYPDGQFRAPVEDRLRAARAALSAPPVSAQSAPSPSPGSLDGGAERRAGETRSDLRVPGLRWAYLPAGTFEMGCTNGDTECDSDESPRHTVRFTRAFEMMTTEMTVSMSKAVRRAIPKQPAWIRNDDPVVELKWDEATALCRAVGGRLPTEAEWEYAARGGAGAQTYPWGNEGPTCIPGRFNGARFGGGDECGENSGGRASGTRYPANGYQLYDVAGNVWEWVADWYGPYGSALQTDPRGPVSGSVHMLRGGAYPFTAWTLRVSNRDYAPAFPHYNYVYFGVRCARDISQ